MVASTTSIERRLTILPLRDVASDRGIELCFEFDLELIEIFRNISAGNTGCQLANVADAALRQSGSIDEAHLDAIGARLHVVFGKTAHTAKLSQRIEISDRRQIRVCRLTEAVEQCLRRGKKRRVDADQHRRSRASWRTNAEIAAARHQVNRPLNREKVVGNIETVRWKNGNTSHEDVVDLLCRLPHRRGRGDDLGLDRVAFQVPAAELVYRGLVESDHRSQRTADKMEFVLNDEIGRPDRRDVLNRRARESLVRTVVAGAIGTGPKKTMPWALGARSSEERSDLTAPCHQRELVHGRDHHRWRPMVNFLVDN